MKIGTFKDRVGSLLRRTVSFEQVFSRACDYKFSMGTAVLCALFEAVVVVLEDDFYIDIGFDESAVFRFMFLFGVMALFSETCFMGRKRLKLLGLLSGVILSGLITCFIGVGMESLVFGIKGVFFYKKAQELMAGCTFLMLVLTVYFSYRKGTARFEEYMLTILVNLLMVFSMYVILLIGIGLVCSCVNTLFFGGGSSIVTVSWILLSGFFLIPGGILALNGKNRAAKELLVTPVQYVLSLMAVCGLVTVYVYAAGILIRWEFPSNEIFSILTTLFCLGMPVWMVAGSILKESRYSRAIACMPYVFAPLILLQIYSIAVRIWEFGLTPGRYAGVMMIVFEGGTLLCWHLKRSRMENVLLIMSGLIVLAFLMPGVNRCRLSERWQQAWLEKYYQAAQKGESLSQQEYNRMWGAYFYLKERTPRGMAGGYDNYSVDILQKAGEGLKDGQQNALGKVDRYSVHGCQLVGGFSVEGFKTMHMLEEADEQPEPDFSAFRFRLRGTDEEITVDISDFAKKAMEYIETNPKADKEEISGYLRSFNRIDVGQGRILYINHFQISYDKGIRDGKDYFKWNGVRNISAFMLSFGEDVVQVSGN